jgi:hypothetical protein
VPAFKVQLPHVLGKILTRTSIFALLLVFDQWRPVVQATTRSPLSPCTTVFSTTLEMPCAHVIKQCRALEHILEQINHKYVELAPHRQVALRKNLKELLYCPSRKNSITISLNIYSV